MTAMRSYACLIVGITASAADYINRHVREGDEIVLQHLPSDLGDLGAVACYHDSQYVGQIESGRVWVPRLLARGDSPVAKVTGLDNDDAGALSSIEIEIAVLDGKMPGADLDARSMISEIGDELRILAMVAAADGRIATRESALLGDFADGRAGALGITLCAGETAHAIRWACRNAPDSLDAARIIARLAKDSSSALPMLLEECELMAEIDGTVGNDERRVVTTLRNLLLHSIGAARNDDS